MDTEINNAYTRETIAFPDCLVQYHICTNMSLQKKSFFLYRYANMFTVGILAFSYSRSYSTTTIWQSGEPGPLLTGETMKKPSKIFMTVSFDRISNLPAVIRHRAAVTVRPLRPGAGKGSPKPVSLLCACAEFFAQAIL